MWWHLIGSAVEHAANLLVEEIDWLAADATTQTPPVKISFRAMFEASEADEEQSTALGTVLDVLRTRWPNGFKAAELVGFVGLADDTSIDLKVALEQATGKAIHTITSTVLAWRLKALIDAPVIVGSDLLVLRYVADAEHGGSFSVRKLR